MVASRLIIKLSISLVVFFFSFLLFLYCFHSKLFYYYYYYDNDDYDVKFSNLTCKSLNLIEVT